MDLHELVELTVGITLVTCVLAVAACSRLRQGPGPAGRPGRPTVGRGPGVVHRPWRHFRDLDRRLRRTRLGRQLELRLAATGLDVTPAEFFVAMLVAVVSLWLIGEQTLAPFFGPIAALVGIWAAVQFLNWQRQKRIEKFINQLPELARILANATHAGLALRTAIGMAAEELEAPAGEELSKVANQLAVGVSLDDALDEMAKRLPSRELVVLVTTLVLSNRAGGQVVSALRNLTETLEERKETRREVRTQLSQVSMTSYAVPVLGIGSLFLMNGVKSGALERMTGSPLGQAAVIIAFGLYAVGFILIRRLSRIDV